MKSSRFRILAAIMTFTVGVTGALILRQFRSEPPLLSPVLATPKRTYSPGMHYDAGRGALQEFNSSDGMSFEKWTISCGSPEGARIQMQLALKKALKIVSREPVLDPLRNQIGEEVVALFPGNDSEYFQAIAR